MSRAKKFFRYSLITLLVLTGIAYFVANHFLDSLSRQAMQTISQRGKQHGVEISEPRFKQAALAGIRTARWTDLSAELRFPKSTDFDANRLFDMQMKQVEVWLVGGGQVTVAVDDLTIATRLPDGEQGESGEAIDEDSQRVHVAHLECALDWQLFDPTASLAESLPKIVELMTEGSANLPLEAEGTLEFFLKKQPTTLRLKIQETPTGNALALEPADVEKLSAQFAEKLTAAEVALVASNPLRAPKLMRIKDNAESTSASARAKDAGVPQDAYRHILWSYLLTKQYGTEFAKRITAAHEQGDTGNTPAEREMDLHNNRIGRKYAAAGLKRAQILDKLQKDRQVIRTATAAP